MGELLSPCLVQGSVGVVYPVRPQEQQPQWRGQLWSPGVSSGRNSVCRAWRLRGGAADVLSWGRSVLAVLGPPGLCLSRGRPDSGLCPAPCAPGPALLDSRSRAAQPPPRSRRPSPSELLLEPRRPLCTEPLPLPEPGRAAPGAAQPPPRSPLRGAATRAPPSCSGSRRARCSP